MTNILDELDEDGAAAKLSTLLQGIGAALGSSELDQQQLYQIVQDLNLVTEELMTLTALHCIQTGTDPQKVAEATGFGQELILTCWFIQNPTGH